AESTAKQPAKRRSWRSYADLWMRRQSVFEVVRRSPVFLTPSLLKQRERELSEALESTQSSAGERAPAMLVGDLAHRFLQSWNFAEDPGAFRAPLDALLARYLPPENWRNRAAVQSDLEEIFVSFFRSKAYAELSASRILGREVPLLLRWDGNIMEGVIDVIFERNGLLYLADYKTDRASSNDLVRHAQFHHQQAEIYTRAAEEALRRNVAGFKIIFLRLGEAMEVRLPPAQGELFG
ncbi:MAG TPA: PD-(D/E)XK nuclease family protein, partial [Candidatus Binatia bacterium]|nr:PD-(D/E)XK nuclease family protein [Candidatus Binatia bacterium]